MGMFKFARISTPAFGLMLSVSSCQTQNKNAASLKDICGSNDLQSVVDPKPKAPWTAELVAKLEPSVVAIKEKTSPTYYCSGFLIGPDLIMTADHCIDWRKARNLLVSFNYQVSADGKEATREDFEVLQVLETGAPKLDYSLVRLAKNAKGETAGSRYPVLSLNPQALALGADILLIQHPMGRPKAFDTGHVSKDGGLRMQFDDLDAETGSSGSPVFNLQGEVVGVHTHGGCKAQKGANKAFRLSEIFKASAVLNPNAAAPLQGTLPASIPDADTRGVRFEKILEDKGPVQSIEVSFAVDHRVFKHLSIYLVAPSGRRMLLRDRASDGQLGLTKMSFPSKEPADSFQILEGEASAGAWQLLVVDRIEGQSGKVLEWELKINP